MEYIRYVSSRQTKHSFIAETSLGPEFSTGWTERRRNKIRSKQFEVKQRLRTEAEMVYERYLFYHTCMESLADISEPYASPNKQKDR